MKLSKMELIALLDCANANRYAPFHFRPKTMAKLEEKGLAEKAFNKRFNSYGWVLTAAGRAAQSGLGVEGVA